MATYKLMQDIEAEDHILGPLSLRQFIFALVAAFFFYLCFIVIKSNVAFLLIFVLPPGLFCAFFAFPFGRDQPTEVWFLAKLRFWFLPRQRIWNQSGVKELVTITVPKKIERVLTDGLSQNEVKSRLSALANTIDSRGWVIKNIGYAQPLAVAGGNSDRLINIDNMPREVPSDDPTSADDFFDSANNPVSQQFDTMINQSSQAHRQKLIEQFNAPVAPAPAPAPTPAPVRLAAAYPTPAQTPVNNWFIGQQQASPPSSYAQFPLAPTAPDVPAENVVDEAELSMQLKQHARPRQAAYGHMRTVQPLGSQPIAPPPASTPPPIAPVQVSTSAPVTAPSDPAILALANNNDLNVATLARQAQKAKERVEQSQNEVVISLH